MSASPHSVRQGTLAAFAAYLIWGCQPVLFWLLRAFGPLEIVAERILWSMLLLIAILAARGMLARTVLQMRDGRVLRAMALSATLIFANWTVYVWATFNGHLMAGSLGYFLNPLMNVALGVLVFHERLRPLQKLAVAVTCAGVAVMAAVAFTTLWISVLIAGSFALYGLVRKQASVDALPGLAIETLMLVPLGVAYLVYLNATGTVHFTDSPMASITIFALGVCTTVTLLLFSVATRNLPMSMLGLIQYVSPTVQFVLSITLFGEHLSAYQMVSFVIIWAGLAIYTVDAIRAGRMQRAAG